MHKYIDIRTSWRYAVYMSIRTTITLDDDVAIMEKQPDPDKSTHYETPLLQTGSCLYPNLDSIADILAAAEKEKYS